jgi:hypothetical protein
MPPSPFMKLAIAAGVSSFKVVSFSCSMVRKSWRTRIPSAVAKRAWRRSGNSNAPWAIA